ncbi:MULTISPECIES: DUF461 domain-containing protein [unclassified Streptomyces]|uniref:DUF461 domain-containing protein n=1 Tax=unclassified Streptomyces TaxID=2593676 RepID=UPI002E2B0216|nr:DUF461 domain-containing protein [Streptomyces sp. NBC_00223]
MVRSFRRGALAAVLVLSLAPLAACAAGDDAQTLEVHPDSASATVGVIKVQNAYVLTDPNGPASVTARLFNNGSSEQTLQAVQLGSSLSARLSGPHGAGAVTVPPHGSVLLGGKGNPAAVIDSGNESLRDGDVQKAIFVFSGTGPVALPINVTPATGYFAPYGPGSAPTTAPPSPTDTPSDTATGSASDTSTPTDTATPDGKDTSPATP